VCLLGDELGLRQQYMAGMVRLRVGAILTL